jgi:hypothetical protein
MIIPLFGTDCLVIPLSGPSRTALKIDSFSALSVGWHYGRGGPISHLVISTAKELYYFLLLVGFTETDAFAGADGEILLTGYHEGHYIAIMIEPCGVVSVTHEHAGEEVTSEEELELQGAKRARNYPVDKPSEPWQGGRRLAQRPAVDIETIAG